MNRAALVYVDGTLIDNNLVHVLAWRRAFERLGVEVEANRIQINVGVRRRAEFRILRRKMGTVFDLLDEVRKRPAMYVGWDEQHRVRQLQDLEYLLSGYTITLRNHSIHEPVADFLRVGL